MGMGRASYERLSKQKELFPVEQRSRSIKSDLAIDVDVVIVGAGIAGLAAAKGLSHGDVKNIIILEAQDYIGGRIKTFVGSAGYLEEGAQWLHGNNSPINLLAEQNNLLSTTESPEGEGVFISEKKYCFNTNVLNEVKTEFDRTLKKLEMCKRIGKGQSVHDFIQDDLSKFRNSNSSQDINDLLEWHKKFLAIDNACGNLNRLSAKRFGDYDYCNDTGAQSHINFKNGFKSFIDLLTSSEDFPKVILNAPVTSIEWNIVKSSDKSNAVMITYNENNIRKRIRAKHCIVTVSLGVLKKKMNKLFSPQLPRGIQRAVQLLGFGVVGKMFLVFSKKWWDNQIGFQLVWENAKNNTNDISWLGEIVGFDVVAVGARHTLLAWVTEEGCAVMEKLDKGTLIKHTKMLLAHYFGPEIADYLTDIHRSTWLTNKYTRGAYSHITTDCDLEDVRPSDLHFPVRFNNNPSGPIALLFAGEACHDTEYSTVHGAYHSGYSQGTILADHMYLNSLPK